MGLLWFIAGALGGAGIMYLLDPHMGNRRRALLRDQVVHLQHEADDALDAVTNDFQNRAQGFVETAQNRFENEMVSDETLEARVRSALGHAVVHAGAVEVSASNGRVTLSGPVLQDEKDRLLATARNVPGVTSLEDRLRLHSQADGVPDLQTGQPSTGARSYPWRADSEPVVK